MENLYTIIQISGIILMFIYCLNMSFLYKKVKQKKEAYKTAVCMAIGSLNSDQEPEHTFKLVEGYVPEEDRPLLRRIFYKTK